MSRRPAPLLLAFWLGGVALATGTGLLGVRLVADRVGDAAVPVLSASDVARDLAATTPPGAATLPARPTTGPASAAPPRSAPPSPSAPVRGFSSPGGTVGVRCNGTTPRRVYAIPAQGYQLDETSQSGNALEVRFATDRTRVRLTISCATGSPVRTEQRVDSKGGGGKG